MTGSRGVEASILQGVHITSQTHTETPGVSERRVENVHLGNRVTDTAEMLHSTPLLRLPRQYSAA